MSSPKELSDIFGRFFIVAGYLPALALLTLFRWLILPGLPPEFQSQISSLNDTGYFQEISVYILIPVFIAAILVGLTANTVRLFSGRPLFRPGDEQSDKYKKFNDLVNSMETGMKNLLTDPFAAASLQMRIQQMRKTTGGAIFFDTSELHSTRLGNVFAALNEYPDRRYGMNAGTIFPRLKSVLPKEFDERIKSQNTSFMFMLNLAFCGIVFALAWILYGVGNLFGWGQTNPFSWIVVFVCVCTGAYLFYRVSVTEASTLVETMTTAFDLYRGRLLKELGFDLPGNIIEEKKLWGTVTAFLLLGNERFYPSKVPSASLRSSSKTKPKK